MHIYIYIYIYIYIPGSALKKPPDPDTNPVHVACDLAPTVVYRPNRSDPEGGSAPAQWRHELVRKCNLKKCVKKAPDDLAVSPPDPPM